MEKFKELFPNCHISMKHLWVRLGIKYIYLNFYNEHIFIDICPEEVGIVIITNKYEATDKRLVEIHTLMGILQQQEW